MKYFAGAVIALITLAVIITVHDWATCDGQWGGTFPMACERSKLPTTPPK